MKRLLNTILLSSMFILSSINVHSINDSSTMMASQKRETFNDGDVVTMYGRLIFAEDGKVYAVSILDDDTDDPQMVEIEVESGRSIEKLKNDVDDIACRIEQYKDPRLHHYYEHLQMRPEKKQRSSHTYMIIMYRVINGKNILDVCLGLYQRPSYVQDCCAFEMNPPIKSWNNTDLLNVSTKELVSSDTKYLLGNVVHHKRRVSEGIIEFTVRYQNAEGQFVGKVFELQQTDNNRFVSTIIVDSIMFDLTPFTFYFVEKGRYAGQLLHIEATFPVLPNILKEYTELTVPKFMRTALNVELRSKWTH